MGNNNDAPRKDRILYSARPKWKLRLRAARTAVAFTDSGFQEASTVKERLVLKFEMSPIPVREDVAVNGILYKNTPASRDMGVANFDGQFDVWLKAGWVQPAEREELWKEAINGPGFGRTYGTKDMVQKLTFGPRASGQPGMRPTQVVDLAQAGV